MQEIGGISAGMARQVSYEAKVSHYAGANFSEIAKSYLAGQLTVAGRSDLREMSFLKRKEQIELTGLENEESEEDDIWELLVKFKETLERFRK